jgi:hypothetical protein
MTLSLPRVRHYLRNFELEKLFVEELGWDRHAASLTVTVGGQSYTLRSLAEKRGVQIFECRPDAGGKIPEYDIRRKIEKQVTKSAYEHLIIFVDGNNAMQIWQWVDRAPGRPAAYREQAFDPQHQSGDALIQKLNAIVIPLDEEEGLDLTGAVHKLRDAFDRDRVTKQFYDRFKKEHASFLEFIEGVAEQGDKEWYASLMLNRLMFIYFIQRKSFLDGNLHYLTDRLQKVQALKGKGKFLTFYRYFLLKLFHEGFYKRPEQRNLDPDLKALLGDVPYLNGGLFELHDLEQKYPKLDIPDEAFEKLFAFFDQYEWTLDTRPLRNDREINPDVLGYIFEKYINQKQMGAYYTKEDITGYISKNTIVPWLFDAARKKCAVAFDPDSSLWRLLRDDPDRYIYTAVRKGVIDEYGEAIPLPTEISEGLEDISRRGGWNRPAAEDYALPTETWREHVARRQRCLELREKLLNGDIHDINDLITCNLDIRQFAEDVIAGSEGPELLRAFWQAIREVTVLDPTCGSGAFLFAALNILEPLYETCLERMQAFVEDLDRSEERHSPKKFEDFRRLLAQVGQHPNRAYFILKTIIVGNLYGVDIMEEAVEICKLRFFLKLVAQVDRAQDLEPLPDIDFNIRAGNTLVGFARLEDVKKTLGTEKFTFAKEEVDQIVEEAELVERAFQKFHQMQTEYGMDAREFSVAKQQLRQKLDRLAYQLDRYLAGEYRINADRPKELEKWRDSHQPFHWFAEFYGIMHRSGFDVIIGNPPYVEYKDVKQQYQVRGFETLPCGDLYAFVLERTYELLAFKGRIGQIVPISVFGVDGFSTLQQLTLRKLNSVWVSSFANRPAQMFDGAQKRLTIMVGHRESVDKPLIFTTRYHRWHREEREVLLSTKLEYVPRPERFIVFPGSLEKLGNNVEVNTFLKLAARKERLEDVLLEEKDGHELVYTRKFGYFLAFLDAVPEIREIGTGKRRLPSELKTLSFASDDHLMCAIAALTSSTFFWFWNALSDCRNLNRRDLLAFPLCPSSLSSHCRSRIASIGRKYLSALRDSSRFMIKSGLKIETFDYASCKAVIDEIDSELSTVFGFDAEKLDFIINYDIKYRMGGDEGDDG